MKRNVRTLTSWIALMLSCGALAACATSIASPSASFCDVADNRLPIVAKRTDHPRTLEQVDIINSIHEANCRTSEMAK